MVDKRGGYNLPKVLCIRGKSHKVTEYEGCYKIKSFAIDILTLLFEDVCECTQSSVVPWNCPSGSDVTPGTSWCSTNQTLIDCLSMSIQLVYDQSSTSDPSIWES